MKLPLKLLCILAHPDDESLALGHLLAKYAHEGVEIYLVTATRGQYGWFGEEAANPGVKALGEIRERELRSASKTLGLKEVVVLDFIDGQLDQVAPQEIVPLLVNHIDRIAPQVIVTFDPFGSYGHPDHIAISQLTLAATSSAQHTVSKVYYLSEPPHLTALFTEAFGSFTMEIDGQERQTLSWPDWSITTEIDTSAYTDVVWRAIAEHESQVRHFGLETIPDTLKKSLYAACYLYRVYSLVNNGRAREEDLFEGLRIAQESP